MMITRVVTTVMVTIMTMTVMMTVIPYRDAGYCFIMLQCNISQGPSVSNAATISKPLVRKYVCSPNLVGNVSLRLKSTASLLASELAAGMHPLVRWRTPHRHCWCPLASAGVFPSSRPSPFCNPCMRRLDRRQPHP